MFKGSLIAGCVCLGVSIVLVVIARNTRTRHPNITRTRTGEDLLPAQKRRLADILRDEFHGSNGFVIGGYRTVLLWDAISPELQQRLIAEHPEFQETMLSVRTGRIRAGPDYLFTLLDQEGIKLYGFSYNGYIILNPAYLEEYPRTILHEIAELNGFSHSDAETLARACCPVESFTVRLLRVASDLRDTMSGWLGRKQEGVTGNVVLQEPNVFDEHSVDNFCDFMQTFRDIYRITMGMDLALIRKNADGYHLASGFSDVFMLFRTIGLSDGEIVVDLGGGAGEVAVLLSDYFQREVYYMESDERLFYLDG